MEPTSSLSRGGLRRLRAAAFAVAAALAALAAHPGLRAQDAWRAAPTEKPLRYTIEASLVKDPEEDVHRRITGIAEINWTNLSRDPVASVWMHLYANAFANPRSAFLRERARDGRKLPDRMTFGGCEVLRVEQVIPQPPHGRQPIRTIVPPDDAPEDETVLRVDLPQPVEPGASVTLRVTFNTTLPTPVARMGAVRDFVMAAQWFPKVGRLLGKESGVAHVAPDGWYCPPYHATSEFAADFADYSVKLTTPKDWVVGATGVREGPVRPDAEGTTDTQTFVAKNVVDFAWTAGRRLAVSQLTIDPDDLPGDDRVLASVGLEVQRVRTLLGETDVDLPNVEVVVLHQPEHADQLDRHFRAARVALALYSAWLGPYPYEKLTIVDPPHDLPVGGMEYPTLVTAGTSVGAPPEGLRLEHVTVHEIGHQWFMNLLASNECDEAWLDEGLNTWFTARAMDVAWGPAVQTTTVLGLHFPTELPYTFPGFAAGAGAVGLPAWLQPPQLDGFRLWRDAPMLLASQTYRYLPRPASDERRVGHGGEYATAFRRSFLRSGAAMDEMVRPSWEFASSDSYRGNAYPRGALLLETLVRHVRARAVAEQGSAGETDADRRIVRAFRAYARQFRFAHPTTQDLVRVLRQELAMPDAPQLFDALAKTTGLLDYAVASVEVREETQPGAPRGTPPEVRSTVRVVRRGEVVVPVTVRIEVLGDLPVEVQWDGVARHRDIPIAGRVQRADVDPQALFPQDARPSNNVWTGGSSPQPAAKWGTHALLWLEHAITSYGRFF